MKKPKMILFFIISCWFLGACTRASQLAPTEDISTSTAIPVKVATPIPLQPTKTPTLTVSPHLTVTKSALSTNTSTPSTTRTSIRTPTKTNTATSFPEPMQFQCLDIDNTASKDFQSRGSIVMFDFRGDSSNYLLDIQTGNKIMLNPGDGGFLTDFYVSPDGKWLAYWLNRYRDNPIESRLFVVTGDGQTVLEIPWEEDWRTIAGWLDNERLLINRREGGPRKLDSLIVLNPFSGQRIELIPSYPNINASSFSKWNFSRTVYDPTLTRVIFPFAEEGHGYIALWDVQKEQRLSSLPLSLPSNPEPRWSPDGEQVLLTALTSEEPSAFGTYKEELYSISFEGQVTRLTHLTDSYEHASIQNFSWSPNNQSVAFWVWTEPSQFEDQQLAVLNIETGEIINYCISGSIKGDAFAPVWSLDSKQIVVENLYDEKDNRIVILVDIVEKWAVKTAENVTPVGWMVNP